MNTFTGVSSRCSSFAIPVFCLWGVPLLLAGPVTVSSNLEINHPQADQVETRGKASVIVQTGGLLPGLKTADESFAAVQQGGHVGEVNAGGASCVQICGGAVTKLLTSSGGMVRITAGTVGSIEAAPDSEVHIYGTELTIQNDVLSGTWMDGSAFSLPVKLSSAAGPVSLPSGQQTIILHEGGVSTSTLPWLHLKMDEHTGAMAYDATTFLHHAGQGTYTAEPLDPGRFGSEVFWIPTLTLNQTGLASGTSIAVTGGGGVEIPGDRLPLLHEGSSISFWYTTSGQGWPIGSVLTKAPPEKHPRALALCQ